MTPWTPGGSSPSSNWSGGQPEPASTWDECAPAPTSSWTPCEAIPPILDPIAQQGEIGTAILLTLNGQNFDASAAVVIGDGTEVLVTDVMFVDENTLLVFATIADTATAGAKSTTVTTSSGTSNAEDFTVYQEDPPVPTPPGDLRLWIEADWGIDDASGAALTEWRDRSGYNHHFTPATALGYLAPVYQASGFGGVTNLPRVNFNDLHGITTALSAGMDLSSFAAIAVFRRDAGDSNSAFIYIISDIIAIGVQDSAASSYLARWNTALKTVLRESSYQTAFGWVSKAVRHVMRVVWNGTTHAGHQQWLEGVQVVIPTQINSVALPMISSGPALVRLGFRDPILPQFNLQGDYAALAIISPKPSDADIAAWETYFTNKWLQAAAPGTPGHGPILVASSTIDGIEVTVTNWVVSGDPAADFGSNAPATQIQVISFSQPIRKFEMTMIGAPTFPNYRVAFGCQGLSPAGTIEGGVTGAGWDSTEGGVRKSMRYDAGFDTVVLRNTLSNVGGSTLVKNARFWLVGEPLE